MAITNPVQIGDWKQLTNEVMTSLFLYGEKTPPQDLNDRVKDPNRKLTI